MRNHLRYGFDFIKVHLLYINLQTIDRPVGGSVGFAYISKSFAGNVNHASKLWFLREWGNRQSHDFLTLSIFRIYSAENSIIEGQYLHTLTTSLGCVFVLVISYDREG